MMLIFTSHITSVKCDIKVRDLGVSVTMMLREFGESSCISCMYFIVMCLLLHIVHIIILYPHMQHL